VIETLITFRRLHGRHDGRQSAEVEKGSVARKEIDALWAAVMSLISEGCLMSDLEGEDMLILQRFGKRPAAASVAGRRERETRPLTAADRRLINRREKEAAPKRVQLNLKVLPEFYERVSALALNEGVAMITVIERAVEAYARGKEG
jgi:hypothetical protein